MSSCGAHGTDMSHVKKSTSDAVTCAHDWLARVAPHLFVLTEGAQGQLQQHCCERMHEVACWLVRHWQWLQHYRTAMATALLHGKDRANKRAYVAT